MMIYPNIKWYESLSDAKSLSARCPFATVSRCPRYYESLSLLGSVGITTKIKIDEDKKLLAFWSKSELWPRIGEEASSISGADKNFSQFSNFCPEVSFNTFGLFATYLSRYADDIDQNSMHNSLISSGITGLDDWRWAWAYVEPMHFSQCSLYSLLLQPNILISREEKKAELLQLRPSIYGIGIDLRMLWTKIKSWWN